MPQHFSFHYVYFPANLFSRLQLPSLLMIPKSLSLARSLPELQAIYPMLNGHLHLDAQIDITLISPSSTPKPNPCTTSPVERMTSEFTHCPHPETCKSPDIPISTLPISNCHVFLIPAPEYLQTVSFLSAYIVSHICMVKVFQLPPWLQDFSLSL